MFPQAKSPVSIVEEPDIKPTTVPLPESLNLDPNLEPPLFLSKSFSCDTEHPSYDLRDIADQCPKSDFKFFNNLLTLQQSFRELNYSPAPSIHHSSAVSFYKNILAANDLVISTLLYGYSPKFHTQPQSSFQRNNLTARQDMTFVREEVTKLVNSQAVVKLDYQPFIVSPLTVASRFDCLTNTTKKRFLIDF